jgi:hypothetical protein
VTPAHFLDSFYGLRLSAVRPRRSYDAEEEEEQKSKEKAFPQPDANVPEAGFSSTGMNCSTSSSPWWW